MPPPVLETVSVCVDGLVCPTMLLNDSAVGLADSRGVVACARMRLTNSVCVPAFELKMIVPVYMPGVRPVVLTAIAARSGVVPLVMPILNQEPPLEVAADALH